VTVTQPRVSVITIFFDAERFLAEAVDSVVAQSFREWELLLVDDGSRDGSPAIARRLADRKDYPIYYMRHADGANHGMSASRNLGLARASGEFIAFLDADDVWLPHKLREQVAVMDSEPEAGLVYGRTQIWHSWSDAPEQPDFFYDLGVAPGRLYRPPELFRLLLENKAQTPTTCNALIRRTLFRRLGGFDESFRAMFEDQTFFAKALLRAPAYVDGRVWARYRQHGGSCSAMSGARGDDQRARLRLLRWLQGYMRECPDADPEARSALTRELLRHRLARGRTLLKRAGKRLKGVARPAGHA
jgi:glycosyltransferase involved in cell wall biosynthesis